MCFSCNCTLERLDDDDDDEKKRLGIIEVSGFAHPNMPPKPRQPSLLSQTISTTSTPHDFNYYPPSKPSRRKIPNQQFLMRPPGENFRTVKDDRFIISLLCFYLLGTYPFTPTSLGLLGGVSPGSRAGRERENSRGLGGGGVWFLTSKN